MSLLDKIKAQIMALIDTANAKTGKTDADLTTAVSSLVDGYGGSGGEDFVKFITSLRQLFYKATITEIDDLQLNVPNLGVIHNNIKHYNIASIIEETRGVKKLSIIKDTFEDGIMDINAFAKSNTTIEEISFNGKRIILSEVTSAFTYASNLKKINAILDCSSAKTLTGMFARTSNIETVAFYPDSIFVNLDMSNAEFLSDDSIQSIIDGLATVETAQTLTLHAAVKAKLTEEQIATITSKNWTLA